LLGQEIEIQEASEPTDIIWENRHFTPRERTYKRVIVWSVIFLMLAISFLIIFTLKKSGDEYKNRYNKKDC
jgi:tryptophan-rich sensory protein